MKAIKILGGGISGLTAAINLKRAGIDVEVYERKRFCGKNTHDFQFLENWTFAQDALQILQRLNISINFYFKPLYSQEIVSPSLKKCLKKSSRPLMYLVKRGQMEESIDQALQKQATDMHIPIIFKSDLTAAEADIVATGKRKPAFTATGITFPFDYPDKSIVILDDNLSFGIYSYFIANDNIGEIVSINPSKRKDHQARFNLTVKRFEELLNFKIRTLIHRFAAPVSFSFLDSARIDGRYYIGEAAGFQDCLNGFGMLYAFKSGYHVARSIIENDDFDHRWQVDFLKPMRVSRTNRLLFERLTNEGYEKLIAALNSRNPIIIKLLAGEDLQLILRRLYNQSISYFFKPLLLWPQLGPLYRYFLRLIGRVVSG